MKGRGLMTLRRRTSGNRLRIAALAGAAILSLAPAMASETISYTYDARGRLVQVNHSGTVNNGVVACYAYDKADNRTNVTVATSSCTSSGPSFSVNDVSATEGSNLSFTVTKTGSTTSSFSVNYATANGSAAAGSDYTSASGTLTFLASETTKTVSVATIDDTAVESAESVLLNLSGASGGATIADSQGVGTINDNDTVTNNPPTPVNDTGSVPKCEYGEFNVTANDTDPDGDYPLAVVSVTGTGFSVVSSTTVGYINNGTSGTKVGTYTVQDSRGAQASATLTITVPSGGVCQ